MIPFNLPSGHVDLGQEDKCPINQCNLNVSWVIGLHGSLASVMLQ